MSRPVHALALVLLVPLGASRSQAQDAPSGTSPPAAAAHAPLPPLPPPAGERVPVVPRRVSPSIAHATSDGNKALLAGRAQDARKIYTDAQVKAPELPELEYDRGLASLYAGDLDAAAQAFDHAPQMSASAPAGKGGKPTPVPPELTADSYFNAGHVAWRKEDVAGAVQRWAQLVAQDPGAKDARRNLELALRLLEEQQQQQQQQKQKQDDKKDQDKPKDQDKQKDQKPKDDQGPKDPKEKGGGGEKPQPQQPSDAGQRPGELSKEQAEQILASLGNDEKQALKAKLDKQAKAVGSPAGKPW